MSKAIESLETVSADEKMLEIYRAREKARRDEISKLAYAKKQGIEQGIEQGEKRAKIETAEVMFKLGVDTEVVEKATKLSLDELKKIEKKVKSEMN